MMKYIRIMRVDHWIKQLFILPGCVCAALLVTNYKFNFSVVIQLTLGFIATCFIASANYVINEWLDAEFDKFHPTKKNRSVITEDVKGKTVLILWVLLSCVGIGLGTAINKSFVVILIVLLFMGLIYNVKPIRTKDIPILDVLTESINNAIRFMLGWFIISSTTIPPSSIVIGYWMGGAFLMTIKRFAEYRMIGNPELAGLYRKSFRFYSDKLLLVSSFFYAMSSVLFIGIFLIKYRIELILFMPFLIGLYSYYLWIAFKEDSAVQKPEKLFHEKKLMIYCIVLIIIFVALMLIDIPALNIFVNNEIIHIR